MSQLKRDLLQLKNLKKAPLHGSQLRSWIRHALDRRKPFQATSVRETIGKQLLECAGRRNASGLVGQQVLEGDVVDVQHACNIDLRLQALMTHFRGKAAETVSRHRI